MVVGRRAGEIEARCSDGWSVGYEAMVQRAGFVSDLFDKM